MTLFTRVQKTSAICELRRKAAFDARYLPGAEIRRAVAFLCAGVLMGSFALGQTVIQCQQTAPFVNPQFADGKSGFSPTVPAKQAAQQFVVGDVDGDGNDEAVAVITVQNDSSSLSRNSILVSRWIQSGWSPMAQIPNTMILANSPVASAPAGSVITPISVRSVTLADVDGDGAKDVVAFYCWNYNGKPSSCQEQIYSYAFGAPVLLTSYDVPYSGASYWFRARSSDKQLSRFNYDHGSSTLVPYLKQYVNGKWVSLPGDGTIVNGSLGTPGATCLHSADCLAFADVNRDGLADLIFIGQRGLSAALSVFILPSTSQAFFSGAPITSSVPVPMSGYNLNQMVSDTLQMGDIFGFGGAQMFFSTSDNVLHLYYWDPARNDFVAAADSYGVLNLIATAGLMPVPSTYTTLPKPLAPFVSEIAFVGNYGAYVIPVVAYPNYVAVPAGWSTFTSLISNAAGFQPSGYSGYFRVATENQNPIMLARSASGLVLTDSKGNDPTQGMDRGYPAYTSTQKAAYQYISGKAAGNSDIRSLYTDPAVPWAFVQSRVQNLAAPPDSTGISAADFQFVQKQTIDELTAVQAVNNLYAITGLILTNTYLVKDAALTETTSVLGLSSQPNVAGNILSNLTTALGNLGSALSFATSIIPLTKSAEELAQLTNKLNAAGNLSYLLGAVTGDIATYTESSFDLSEGVYDLKTALDNQSLGAATSNACHQLSALSSWNQSKFIADGVLTGVVPLDVDTQQDMMQAGEALFRLNVWQALVPSKWSELSVNKNWVLPPFCGNCLFTGNASYPANYSIQVSANCGGVSKPVSLILEDPNTHNYPNLTAMNALFASPPNGLGARPADMLLGNNGWSVPYVGQDSNFFLNTGYIAQSCSGFNVLNPQITPNGARPQPEDHTSVARGGLRPVRKVESTEARIAALAADASSKLTDARLRDRLVMFLQVAGDRLKQDQLFNRSPDETIRLLNLFITQSQWHAGQGASDSEVSRAESVTAVAIRDSLINSTAQTTLQ